MNMRSERSISMPKPFLSSMRRVGLIVTWCIVALALLAWAIFCLIHAWPLMLWAVGIDLALFHLLVWLLPVSLVTGLIRGLYSSTKGVRP
jgi:uncharacterized membrane protein